MERMEYMERVEYIITPEGKIFSEWKNGDGTRFELSLFMNGRYVRIRGKRRKVAEVVAEKYVPNHLKLPYVVHINGDKSDNRAENLRWSAEPEKIVGHGRRPVTRVSEDGGVVQFASLREAAEKTGVYKYGILECLKGRRREYKGYKWYEKN